MWLQETRLAAQAWRPGQSQPRNMAIVTSHFTSTQFVASQDDTSWLDELLGNKNGQGEQPLALPAHQPVRPQRGASTGGQRAGSGFSISESAEQRGRKALDACNISRHFPLAALQADSGAQQLLGPQSPRTLGCDPLFQQSALSGGIGANKNINQGVSGVILGAQVQQAAQLQPPQHGFFMGLLQDTQPELQEPIFTAEELGILEELAGFAAVPDVLNTNEPECLLQVKISAAHTSCAMQKLTVCFWL